VTAPATRPSPVLRYALPAGWQPLPVPRDAAQAAAAAAAIAAGYPELNLGPVGLARLLASLAAASAALPVLDAYVTVADTAAGPQPVTLTVAAVLSVTGTAAAPERDPGPGGAVQYQVEIAGGRAVCLLMFAALGGAPASELRPLFDRIAASVRCDPPDATDVGAAR